jgi:Helicase conserved C-terminal domain
MNEHEYPNQVNCHSNADEKRQCAVLPPPGAQPLILFDLATIVGAVYQQQITTTKRGTLTKRFGDLLRPLLHGLSRNDERQVDSHVDMLFKTAQQLELINIDSPYYEGKDRPYYRPSIESGLEKWSQINVYEQTRQFLVKWRESTEWQDIWSADFQQWDASDWNPLAARGLLIELLGAGIFEPEQWYLVSSLLETIWFKGFYLLRPTRYKQRSRTQSIPFEIRRYWDQCERIVYLGILSSTLSELGIVSLASRPTDYTTGTLSQPTRFKLTGLGAQVLSNKQPSPATGRSSRILIVQPTFEVILLQFDPPTLYQLLPFTEIKLVEQASRLTLTRNSILRGLEAGMTVEGMLAILNASSKKAVPQNVIRTMQDWSKTCKGTTVGVQLIEVTSEESAGELCLSPKLREFGLERIAPRRLLAHTVYDYWEYQRLLKKAGIVARD